MHIDNDFENTIVYDIDGTLLKSEKRYCSQCERMEYFNTKPILEEIFILNALYDEGKYVILHTGRKEDCRKVTEEQLAKHGIKYHELRFNKPIGRYYIDSDSLKTGKDLL